jgi:hypothetical protein
MSLDPSATRAAIQAAVDAHDIVLIRPGTWEIDGPIYLDRSGVTILGEPYGRSTIAATAGYAGDLFVFGVPRNPQSGAVVTSAHYPQLPTDSGAGGTKYGIRFVDGGTYLIGSGTCFDADGTVEYWRAARSLTLDLYMDMPAGPPSGSGVEKGMLCGFGQVGDWGPFYCTLSADSTPDLSFVFRTADGVIREFRVADLTPGPLKITVQIDLATPAVLVAIDDVQVAVNTTPIGANWTSGADLHFWPTEGAHFAVNAAGGNAFGGPQLQGHSWEWTVRGLKLTRGLVYTPQGTGQALVRVDGQANTSARRYYTVTTNTAACLPLATSFPGASVREVPVKNGYGGTTANLYLWDLDHLNPNNTKGSLRLKDLTLRTHDFLGRALVLGNAIDCRAYRCDFSGGSYGVGTAGLCVNYQHQFIDCHFAGTESGLHLWRAAGVLVQSPNFYLKGRYCVRLQDGCEVTLRDTFVAVPGNPDGFIRVTDSSLVLEQFDTDAEGQETFGELVHCSSRGSSGSEFAPLVRIKNLGMGHIRAADGCFVRLTGTGPGHLELSGLKSGDAEFFAAVADDSTAWTVNLDLSGWRKPNTSPAIASAHTVGDRHTVIDPR